MTDLRTTILEATAELRASCIDLEALATVDRALTEEEVEVADETLSAIMQQVYTAMRAIWDAPESAEAASPVAGVRGMTEETIRSSGKRNSETELSEGVGNGPDDDRPPALPG